MSRNLDHILLSGYASSSLYTSPNTGRDRVVAIPRNRNSHGNSIKNQLESAVNSFRDNIDSDSVYLEFVSEKDCLLAFDSFEDGRRHDFKFMSSKLNVNTVSKAASYSSTIHSYAVITSISLHRMDLRP